jgi:hypothetical protein
MSPFQEIRANWKTGTRSLFSMLESRGRRLIEEASLLFFFDRAHHGDMLSS